MKKWLGVLAIVLLLAGCSDPAPQEIEDSATVPTVQSPEQTVNALCDPENPIEEQTDGAVKAYVPENGCTYVASLGKHILLFTEDGIGRYRGERLTEVATVEIPDIPTPGSGMLQIKEDGIAYYDAKQNRIVFLNQFFVEVGMFSLPEGILGDVYLSADWSLMYYCSEAGVHIIDLDSGVSRLLMAQSADWLGISGGFLNGTVLRCSLKQENGEKRTMLISAETGAVLAEGSHLEKMRGSQDYYYLPMEEDYVFGKLEEQPQNLLLSGDGALYPLPNSNGAVEKITGKNGCRLNYYDIASGKRTATIKLSGIKKISKVFQINSEIWFVSGDTLYCWDTAKSPVEDEKIYTEFRYFYENPDEDGLAAIQKKLTKLEKSFGVQIYYWNEVEALAPWDYSFTAEYLTEPYTQSISQIKRVLQQLPEGFLQSAVAWTNSKKLNIILVRGIYAGVETDKYTSAPGIQFNADGDAYIALSVGEELEQWFYHELGHLIDSRVMSTVNTYSGWNSLNPWDFKYDNDYEKNLERTDSKYVEGDKRYFVDLYSMSFAVEDRSRIFEYACMPGNEAVFASQYMQKKLKTVCTGIRKAFGLTGETYIWEQYLQ